MTEISQEPLKICSLNCHGLKGNVMYLDYLLSKYKVLFLNEHWILEKEKFIFEKLCKNHNLFFQSAQTHINSKGRPYGGLAWVISKDIKTINIEFISANLSFLEVEVNNFPFIFIGVYAFYNNNTIENFFNQEILFENCKQLVLGHSTKNIFILGDFNCDPYRNNKFDKMFISFIDSNNLEILSILHTQLTPYSFNTGHNKSLIDHIAAAKSNLKCITPICNIIDDSLYSSYCPDSISLSDHCTIELNLYFDEVSESVKTQNNLLTEIKQTPNWKNEKTANKFMNNLDTILANIYINQDSFYSLNEHDKQNWIDRLYSDITTSLRTSVESVCLKNKQEKNQNWWSDELLDIKNKIKLELKKRVNLPKEFSFTLLKEQKKSFRKVQRKNIYLYENNKIKNTDNIYKSRNMNKFWKKIKILKSKKNQ